MGVSKGGNYDCGRMDRVYSRSPHVADLAAGVGDGCRAECAGEETRHEDGLHVLRDGADNVEDGEDGVADRKGQGAAVDLGQGSPDEGADAEACRWG